MKTYKLRAECLYDVSNFLQLTKGLKNIFIFKPDDKPDVVLSFDSSSTLNQIKFILNEVVDGHVMVETVQPQENYTGVRTYENIRC